MRYDVVRVVDGDERRDVEAEAAALGATVVSLDALDAVLAEAAAHGGDCAAVVASQGHYDEPALEAILRSGVRYVGLVASRKRGATVRAWLAESGVPGVDRLRNPAGLDLGGRSAEEVALSILGEIVQLGAARQADAPAPEIAARVAARRTRAPDGRGRGPRAPATGLRRGRHRPRVPHGSGDRRRQAHGGGRTA